MTDASPLHLRAWDSDAVRSLEDDLDEKPLAICASGGGFRSYACVLGQLRALHDLGVMDHIGLMSGVSGGAWGLFAHRFAPAAEIRHRLGTPIDPAHLTLDALRASIDETHLAHPITQFDAIRLGRQLREEVPTERLFSTVLGRQLLAPLGVSADRPILSASQQQTRDLRSRNPDLAETDILEPPTGRPPVVAGACVLTEHDGAFSYDPIEITPSAITRVQRGQESPVHAMETPALVGALLGELKPGIIPVTRVSRGFSLGDLLAATGGAPGGILVQLARQFGLEAKNLVLHGAQWLTSHDAPFYVDGGYVDNTGVLAALRRGAERLMVFVNTNATLADGDSAYHVEGIEAQISRLFGRTPSWGMYSEQPLPLFPEAELTDLAADFRASRDRGELPWALRVHHLREDNALGIPPRPVTIYWQLNQLPAGFMTQLPRDTRAAVRSPFGALYGVPHLGVAFAYRGYLFRLDPAQIAIMTEMHDHALRARPAEVWERLLVTE